MFHLLVFLLASYFPLFDWFFLGFAFLHYLLCSVFFCRSSFSGLYKKSFCFWKSFKNIVDFSFLFSTEKKTPCLSSFVIHGSCNSVFHARSYTHFAIFLCFQLLFLTKNLVSFVSISSLLFKKNLKNPVWFSLRFLFTSSCWFVLSLCVFSSCLLSLLLLFLSCSRHFYSPFFVHVFSLFYCLFMFLLLKFTCSLSNWFSLMFLPFFFA